MLRQKEHQSSKDCIISVKSYTSRNTLRQKELLTTPPTFPTNTAGTFRQLLERLGDHLKALDRQVQELEVQFQSWHRENVASKKLAQIPGIGPITASALIASVGDAKNFKNGRQLAAWLGLVPRQHSSGGKQTLLGISKRGDSYLRTLLIHGARAVLRVAERKAQHADSWLAGVMGRRNHNVAAVALANKNARIVWALLAQEREYKANYGVAA
jgi:transposase